jgi:hypothetical protein
MKKTILILAILVLTVSAAGAQMAKEVKFAWDDDNEKAAGYEWLLFMRTEGEAYNYDAPALVVPWTAGMTEYVGTGNFSIDGKPNALARRYFVVRAKSENGVVSGDSNEVYIDVRIPPGKAYNLTVTVVVK